MNEPTAREAGASARAATWADADALAASMAKAFYDDPLMTYMLPDDATRLARAARSFKLLLKLGLPHGGCDITSGAEGAALWRPPGRWNISYWQYLTNAGDLLGAFGWSGARRVTAAMDVIEKHHPHEPHWYLQAIGTDPAWQGKGYGGLLMRRGLGKADTAGEPAYLESSKASNIPIYESYGFKLTGELTIPGGPTLYPMWRAPQPRS